MSSKHVIGLDIGTTSAKAVIFYLDGTVLSEDEQFYPIESPYPSWSEQNPLQIESAAINAMKYAIQKANISGNQVLSVGLSSAMHSLICVDEKWNPLSPCFTWADNRSVMEASKLKVSDLTKSLYYQTGTPIHPMSPLVKLIWMRENGYEAYKNATRFVSMKEFLTGRWFNVAAVDYSTASASGLFHIRDHLWSSEALDLAGIHSSQLSQPVEPTFLYQNLHPSVANEIGILHTVPFAAGGSDGPLANLGTGAISPGETAITIGTSGAIRQMSRNPVEAKNQQAFCYAFSNDLWIVGGPTNNGGNVLQWVHEVLEEGDSKKYDSLLAAAEKIPPGSDGLLFLPFLHGERAPHWDANARGTYIGISANHQKGHLIRSSLEGVLFNLKTIHNALTDVAITTSSIYASGGFARSDFWVQMLADIFGVNVYLPKSHQSSAWGAAWCSLVAINEAKDLESIKNYIPMKSMMQPIKRNNEIYEELYPIYENLFKILQPTFHQLQNFTKKASKK
ncbi:gluconokinase [Evansella sp. AB-rgal1]|uniref:gluconokinase n=1 Tax=Evansella sp. AB-rgal1 TaxID=3242696 RepID=UPI00359ECE0D